MFSATDLCELVFANLLALIIIVGERLRRVTQVVIVFHLTQLSLTAGAVVNKGLVEVFEVKHTELFLD